MHRMFLALMWLFFQSEHLVVVYVDGTAVVRRNGHADTLRRGSLLSVDDSIEFPSGRGAVRIAGSRGTFRMSPATDPRNNNRAEPVFLSVAKSLMPTLVSGEMKTRAGAISNDIEASGYFHQFDKPDRPMLLVDSLLVTVSKDYIRDTTKLFFYISYRRGEEKINKRILFRRGSSGYQLVLNQSIFQVDGHVTEGNSISSAEIFTYEPQKQKSHLISSFNIRFVSFDQLKPELCLIKSGLASSADSGAGQKTINDYLIAYYGILDNQVFLHRLLPQLNCKNQ